MAKIGKDRLLLNNLAAILHIKALQWALMGLTKHKPLKNALIGSYRGSF